MPTDRQILEVIHSRYEQKYKAVSSGQDTSASDNRIYLPVDLAAVADELGIDGNIVFGRLYYFLNGKYAHKTDPEGRLVHLLWTRFGAPQGDHWVNFPLLASVLAALQEEDRGVKWTRNLAIGSLAVSVAALALSMFSAFGSMSGQDIIRAVDPRLLKSNVEKSPPIK